MKGFFATPQKIEVGIVHGDSICVWFIATRWTFRMLVYKWIGTNPISSYASYYDILNYTVQITFLFQDVVYFALCVLRWITGSVFLGKKKKSMKRMKFSFTIMLHSFFNTSHVVFKFERTHIIFYPVLDFWG